MNGRTPGSWMAREDCARCGLAVTGDQGYVLYVHPDPSSTARVIVHGECIADEVAEGRLERISGFSFRVLEGRQ